MRGQKSAWFAFWFGRSLPREVRLFICSVRICLKDYFILCTSVWMCAQKHRCPGRPEEGARFTGTGVTGAAWQGSWEPYLGPLEALVRNCSSSLLNRQLWGPDSMQGTVMDVESAVEKCSPHPSRFYIQHWGLERRSQYHLWKLKLCKGLGVSTGVGQWSWGGARIL